MSLVVPYYVGSSPTRDQIHVSCIGMWILYHWATREAPRTFFFDTFKTLSVLKARGFPGDAVVKNPFASAGDARDAGSILGLGRSPGEGNGNPLQYSCLKFQGQRSLVGYIQSMGSKESDTTEHTHTHTHTHTHSVPSCPAEGLSLIWKPAGLLPMLSLSTKWLISWCPLLSLEALYQNKHSSKYTY